MTIQSNPTSPSHVTLFLYFPQLNFLVLAQVLQQKHLLSKVDSYEHAYIYLPNMHVSP